MNLKVANRCLGYDADAQGDWWPNPEWVTAPHELVQLPDDPSIPPVAGPFRFKAKDIEDAVRYAREQNWDALQKLAVPERIPPTK